MRYWLPERRILNALSVPDKRRPGSGRPYPPLWRVELRKQLQGKPTLTASL